MAPTPRRLRGLAQNEPPGKGDENATPNTRSQRESEDEEATAPKRQALSPPEPAASPAPPPPSAPAARFSSAFAATPAQARSPQWGAAAGRGLVTESGLGGGGDGEARATSPLAADAAPSRAANASGWAAWSRVPAEGRGGEAPPVDWSFGEDPRRSDDEGE